jgi:hypothetical protein
VVGSGIAGVRAYLLFQIRAAPTAIGTRGVG